MTKGMNGCGRGGEGGSLSRGFGFWEIEANSQLPPLVECRAGGKGARPLSVHLSVLLSSSLRFAGYFDVPNLIEGIRRTDLLTSSLLIAVLFDVAAADQQCTTPCTLSLSRTLFSFWNRADPLSPSPISDFRIRRIDFLRRNYAVQKHILEGRRVNLDRFKRKTLLIG